MGPSPLTAQYIKDVILIRIVEKKELAAMIKEEMIDYHNEDSFNVRINNSPQRYKEREDNDAVSRDESE